MPSLENGKYMGIKSMPTPPDRKTKIFSVFELKTGYQLGEIKWFPRWRCYSFYPAPNTVFDEECTKQIYSWLIALKSQEK